jgi:hypothetical protein
MYPTCSRLLSHENPDDSDVGRARPLRPPLNIDILIPSMNVRSEDELATLVPPGCCENSSMTTEVVPRTCHHMGTILR